MSKLSKTIVDREHYQRRLKQKRFINANSKAFKKTQKEIKEEREFSRTQALKRLVNKHKDPYKWSYQMTL